MNVKDYYRDIERYDWITEIKYPEKIFHGMREWAIVKMINEYCVGLMTLDLGCGTGLITRHIESMFVVALDINPWNIARAKEHLDGKICSFDIGDAEDLKYPDETFNTVVCTDVLEHLECIDKAVGEINRVLKFGGVLIGSVPSQSIVWRYRKLISTTCPAGEPFHHNYSYLGIANILIKRFHILRLKRGTLGLEWFFVCRKLKP